LDKNSIIIAAFLCFLSVDTRVVKCNFNEI